VSSCAATWIAPESGAGAAAGGLGNTPAVAQSSYIDPRVIALYEQGITIAPALPSLGEESDFGELATHGRTEQAVLDLLE
jgi:DNA topoisomerase-1